MARLFRSKSCSLSMPPPLYEEDNEEDDEGYSGGDFNTDDDENPAATTPFLSPAGGNIAGNQAAQFSVLGVVAAALRKSLVTCSVDTEDDDDIASDVDISWPTDVRHVSHVTFDRFKGFLGLPLDLQPHLPPKPPSASASVFGVSAQSMQCAFDQRGNSVPTILLRMQSRLYSEGGLQAEGIFRINAENSEEESVRKQLNKGVVPHRIDVHCLAGLIKAWFRELPSGVLDSLRGEEVMHCNTEEECRQVVKLLPPTEAALLDWAVNLMADVVQQERHNKMNARNIAMVFAPNMTHMADPLTALIHAVQVMNILKTLIGITVAQRQREEEEEEEEEEEVSVGGGGGGWLFTECCSSASDENRRWENNDAAETRSKSDVGERRKRQTFGQSLKDDEDEDHEKMELAEEEEEEGILHRLSLRKGMQKLCRHPVFQLSKKSISRGGGRMNGKLMMNNVNVM